MIEAMACGTPVIAFRRGSVPEIIDDGATGFIVDDIEESLHAVEKVLYFDRQRCRRVFEERFSVARFAGDYLKIYEKLLEVKYQSRLRRLAQLLSVQSSRCLRMVLPVMPALFDAA